MYCFTLFSLAFTFTFGRTEAFSVTVLFLFFILKIGGAKEESFLVVLFFFFPSLPFLEVFHDSKLFATPFCTSHFVLAASVDIGLYENDSVEFISRQ